ncbi:fumarylacetoacetate hydrolase family protein [Paenibacillus sp. GSMTC-2017]|uniref:fumarylacetoacetate hydrolase family protein n=1 Tax=Paenibacillus sp. GSMTC-2017 TaxID=2794350 RepID=UPI0018D81EB6|nr:fumarylacetoacetate hydrolase family protein [Paenibacillus sp. GSMTC-2017]MBH5318926.1 fumarylacetoacetate hydrolase family protein [Paenibacillus sp. GSMTC-2017]
MFSNRDIKNIYCIGRNYRLHALELGNEVPEQPLVFTKPSHSATLMDGNTITLPANVGEVHFELEIVLKISDVYIAGAPIEESIDAITLGLDLTLRDVQSKLKAKGQPWLAAKGFKQSAPLGTWIPFPGEAELGNVDFKLIRNGETAQIGNAKDMLFGISELVKHIEANYGLGAGDIIFTGTPAGVAALQDGDQLEAYWGEQELGNCSVKLA